MGEKTWIEKAKGYAVKMTAIGVGLYILQAGVGIVIGTIIGVGIGLGWW